mmetsp:Transcript_74360/g.212017  ORF Transcript_74360/g.212017 Transcript_74360/m.212017 type:complete len:423 (-) Transcript_74360:253-1521(-)
MLALNSASSTFLWISSSAFLASSSTSRSSLRRERSATLLADGDMAIRNRLFSFIRVSLSLLAAFMIRCFSATHLRHSLLEICPSPSASTSEKLSSRPKSPPAPPVSTPVVELRPVAPKDSTPVLEPVAKPSGADLTGADCCAMASCSLNSATCSVSSRSTRGFTLPSSPARSEPSLLASTFVCSATRFSRSTSICSVRSRFAVISARSPRHSRSSSRQAWRAVARICSARGLRNFWSTRFSSTKAAATSSGIESSLIWSSNCWFWIDTSIRMVARPLSNHVSADTSDADVAWGSYVCSTRRHSSQLRSRPCSPFPLLAYLKYAGSCGSVSPAARSASMRADSPTLPFLDSESNASCNLSRRLIFSPGGSTPLPACPDIVSTCISCTWASIAVFPAGDCGGRISPTGRSPPVVPAVSILGGGA